MTKDLRGKVALVTGSSSGIGAATARALAGAGASVVVNSARSVEAGQALADELPGASYVQADIADEDGARRLVADAVERHGRLDILVNNAGTTEVIPHHDLDAVTPEIWRRILNVNVIGTWQVAVAAVAHLRASGDGAIVNVSSIAGHRAAGSSIPYAASKAALSHMTTLLANVLGPEIRVNGVAPGLVDTRWTADWDTVRAFVTRQAPLKRSGLPEDIAHLIVSLATASYVTGETVLVDGGMHLR
jgi:ketoreductase RED2